MNEKIVNSDKRIVIWGADNRAHRFMMDYDVSEEKIIFLVDRKKEKQDAGFVYILGCEKKEVCSPDILNDIAVDEFLWVITVGQPEEILEELNKRSAKNILVYPSDYLPCRNNLALYSMWAYHLENDNRHNLSVAELKEKYNKLFYDNKFVLPRMTMVLTTRCTFRCKECIEMIPYLKKHEDVEKEQIFQDIDNLVSNVDECVFLELIGGEPFLYKDLDSVLRYVLKENKIRNVAIVTNGTVTLSEDMLSLLKHEKLSVIVSDYGISDKTEIFVEELRNQGICVNVLYEQEWFSAGSCEKRNRGMGELKKQYDKCHAPWWCKTMYNGFVYACIRSIGLYDLGYIDEKQDLLEITPNCREKIEEFFKRDWCEACDHCDWYTENHRYCKAGEQLN